MEHSAAVAWLGDRACIASPAFDLRKLGVGPIANNAGAAEIERSGAAIDREPDRPR